MEPDFKLICKMHSYMRQPTNFIQNDSGGRFEDRLRGPGNQFVHSPSNQSFPNQLNGDSRATKESLNRKLKILRSKLAHQQSRHWSRRTRFYAGLPSWKAFEVLFNSLLRRRARKLTLSNKKRKAIWYRKNRVRPGPPRKLSEQDQFLMTMMCIRLDFLEEDLADRFEASQTTVSRLQDKWIPLIASKVKKLIVFSKAEKVRENLPKVFKPYPRTRVIIDCTEIFIQRPTILLARQETWSEYKHHNTAKLLVGITHNGAVCSASKLWGGRACDKHIVKNSGPKLIDNLDPDDHVMADRGFDIADVLALKAVTLNIPPFTKGKIQLSRVEMSNQRKVCKLRLHVERGIERIKDFRILQGVFPLGFIYLMI